MKDEKNPAQELREKLFAQPKHAALRMSDDEISAAFEWCEGYKTFLSDNRTEREITAFSQKLAEARGFEKFDSSKKYSAGDKVWFNVKEKAIILAVFGTRPLSDGVKIAAAHIDSPRLDVKPNPCYEDCEIGTLQDPLLRRYKEISVADSPAFAPRRYRQGGRREDNCFYRRQRGRAAVRYQRPAPAS